ncbi:arabinan endo-1,5-alpha-L-arabinosidase, partial [Novipirellula herctigrandis]|uniref:arabinan endo-1,5-alpha-L-arabinosidase n=1 Tax=Novipirellula herctigrandis TaxID=2527986 RepID=UPI003AF337DA
MRQRVRSKKSICFFMATLCLFAVDVQADDAATAPLNRAITALGEQASYSWTASVDVPEGTRFRPGPTQGRIERGGMTHVTMSFDRRPTHIVIDGNTAAVTNRDGGWDTVSLLDQGYGSSGFSASLARDAQVPVVEAKTLLALLDDIRREGESVVGTLPSKEAAKRLATRRIDEGDIRGAEGTVRFWSQDGVLAKYEVHVKGHVPDEDDVDRDIWRRASVEMESVGSTEIELPGGAAQALRRPLPKPQPRLSDEDAKRLLQRYGKRDISVHDPSSIIKCGSKYWLFSTGSFIPSWWSEDQNTWHRGPTVFSEIAPWVTDIVPDQRGHYWAPDIIKQGDRYLLYYSVSSFGKNTSAIALASSPTLDPDDEAFGWTDHGIVIETSSSDDSNAIDPAIIATESGQLWMSFGSYWSGLKLVQLDPLTGKRISPEAPLHSLAANDDIEAAHIVEHDGWFYLMFNWGKCCRGVDSTYNIRVGRSRHISGPYLDKKGINLLDQGGSLVLGTDGPFIGPGHANLYHDGERYWFHCHYYDATERGRSRLAIMELKWDKDGWPVVDASETEAGTGVEATTNDHVSDSLQT